MTWWYIPAAGITTLVICHIIKELIHIHQTGSFSWYTLLLETGGMPSAHSATTTAVTIAILLQEGFVPVFWLALVLTGVVVRDAFGVRKSVSDQALLLNKLTKRMDLEAKVNVILGHTPLQAAVGIVIGAGVSILWWLVI